MAESKKKSIWLWVVIGILVVAVLFLTLKSSATGSAVSATKVATSAASSMVGGC